MNTKRKYTLNIFIGMVIGAIFFGTALSPALRSTSLEVIIGAAVGMLISWFIAAAVRENAIVALKADWTNRDPEVTRMLEQLGSKQVPVIAIFPANAPTRPVVLRGGYTQASLLAAIKSATVAR